MTLQDLEEFLDEFESDASYFVEPDYADAIIGYSEEEDRLIYSFDAMVDAIMKQDRCEMDEAICFVEFNTLRTLSYMGEHRPIISYTIPL